MTESRSATVRVPASTSNLGAGFDCIGLAVDRWLTASVVVTSERRRRNGGRVEIARRGTLSGLQTDPKEDLVYVGFELAHRVDGVSPLPAELLFTVSSEIPVSRGLGSSAAALVAGAALANEVLDLGQSPQRLIEICAQVEGHPDNVGAAVLGGGIVSIPSGTGYVTARLTVSPQYAFVFAIPPFTVETKGARKVLPHTVTHADATRATGRAAGLVHALAAGDDRMLETSLVDEVLHIPFRRSLVRGFDEVVAAARGAGALGGTLSGSGPTIVAIAPTPRADAVAIAMRQAWRALDVDAETFVSTATSSGCSIVHDPSSRSLLGLGS